MHRLIERYRKTIDNPRIPAFARRWVEKKGKQFFRKTFELRHTRLHKYRVKVTRDISLTLWLDWMDYTDAGYLFNPQWEPPILQLMLKTLKEEDTFVDVGANIGYFSMVAAKVCKKGRSIAIEPLSRNIDVIRKNIASNDLKNYILDPVAVAGSEGQVTLRFRYLNSGSPSTHGYFGAKDPVVSHYMMEETVATKSIPKIFADHGVQYCRLMKFDAQGAEDESILAMEDLLKAKRVGGLIVEYNSVAYKDGRNLADFLASLGYKAYEISERGDTRPIETDKLVNKQNYLFSAS